MVSNYKTVSMTNHKYPQSMAHGSTVANALMIKDLHLMEYCFDQCA